MSKCRRTKVEVVPTWGRPDAEHMLPRRSPRCNVLPSKEQEQHKLRNGVSSLGLGRVSVLSTWRDEAGIAMLLPGLLPCFCFSPPTQPTKQGVSSLGPGRTSVPSAWGAEADLTMPSPGPRWTRCVASFASSCCWERTTSEQARMPTPPSRDRRKSHFRIDPQEGSISLPPTPWVHP